MQTINQKTFWKISLINLQRGWRQVFAVHLVYTSLGFILFTPLVAVISRLLLTLSDQPALADQDIAWFLLTPTGMTALIFLAALLITILAVEQASLMTLAAAGLRGQNIRAMAALRFTVVNAHSIFTFAIRLVVRVLLLTLPFLAAAALTAWFMLSDYDINYYLSAQPQQFWVTVTIIGLLLLAMTIMLVRKLLAWSIALPLVLFAGVKPAKSFAESETFTRGHKRRLISVLSVWALLTLVLGAILSGVILQLGSLIFPGLNGSIRWLVPVLGAIVALWALVNFISTVFTNGSFAYVLVTFYQHYSPGDANTNLAVIADRRPAHTRKPTALKLALALGVTAVSAVLVGNWLLDGIQINDTVTVIGHRGAAGKAPENTLASIRQAIEDGADWVEIDVQETLDGEVVVIHDSDFMKLAGINLKVWDGTLEQIRKIDIGSWFDPRFSSERVPTLAEVLAEARGQAGVVIELKYYGHDQQLEQRVVDIVERLGMTDEIVIMSLNYVGIQKIRALRPSWTIGLLSAKAIGNLARLDVDFLAVAKGMATPGFVLRSHAQGKPVFVWTINDTVTLSRMMSIGVDGIITDEPALAKEVIADRADLNPAERLLMHTAVLFGKQEPQRHYRDASP